MYQQPPSLGLIDGFVTIELTVMVAADSIQSLVTNSLPGDLQLVITKCGDERVLELHPLQQHNEEEVTEV
jgi:hypothetical protein